MQRTEAKKTVEKLTGKSERKKKTKSAEVSMSTEMHRAQSEPIPVSNIAPLIKKPLPDIRPKVRPCVD